MLVAYSHHDGSVLVSDSPLSEADPLSIAEIMRRDPLELTRSNRDSIVAVLRSARAEFAQQEAKPKASKKRAALTPIDSSTTLDDLLS